MIIRAAASPKKLGKGSRFGVNCRDLIAVIPAQKTLGIGR
jgi:hypothetical protein